MMVIGMRQSLLLLLLLNALGGVIGFHASHHFSSLHHFQRTSTCSSEGTVALHAASSSSQEEAVQQYCHLVQTAVDDEQFVSLHLKGPSKKKATKDELRGCLATVQGRLVEIPKKKSAKPVVVLQSTIKYHGATDVAKNWELEQVGESLQELLLSTESNDYKSEWGTWHASGTPLGLASCTLVTTTQTTELILKTNKMRTRKTKADTVSSAVGVAKHDRTKQVPVSQEAPFWQAIGLTKKPAKRRQCQKFVEIVGNLVQKQMTDSKSSSISTVDMGCGRGYLTFALHHYLQETYSAETIQTRGIDMRPKLVAEMNAVVSSLGETMAPGLLFETGTIERFLEATTTSAEQQSKEELQVLIALHACDTATDDALWTGIQSNADILVVAPCCHKQIRPQLDWSVRKGDHPLQDVLRHGIYRERMAETVTDSMRALLLELAHYQVQVFEFIGGEHTAKNVMITAVKLPKTRGEKELDELRRRLHDLAQLNGVRSQKLAEWMEEAVTNGEQEVTPMASAKAMPPL